MKGRDPQAVEKARKAREALVRQLLPNPDISLIDIGYDPEESGSRRLVLRVHTRRALDAPALGIPEEVDGIPVRVLAGDYRLE